MGYLAEVDPWVGGLLWPWDTSYPFSFYQVISSFVAPRSWITNRKSDFGKPLNKRTNQVKSISGSKTSVSGSSVHADGYPTSAPSYNSKWSNIYPPSDLETPIQIPMFYHRMLHRLSRCGRFTRSRGIVEDNACRHSIQTIPSDKIVLRWNKSTCAGLRWIVLSIWTKVWSTTRMPVIFSALQFFYRRAVDGYPDVQVVLPTSNSRTT